MSGRTVWRHKKEKETGREVSGLLDHLPGFYKLFYHVFTSAEDDIDKMIDVLKKDIPVQPRSFSTLEREFFNSIKFFEDDLQIMSKFSKEAKIEKADIQGKVDEILKKGRAWIGQLKPYKEKYGLYSKMEKRRIEAFNKTEVSSEQGVFQQTSLGL